MLYYRHNGTCHVRTRMQRSSYETIRRKHMILCMAVSLHPEFCFCPPSSYCLIPALGRKAMTTGTDTTTTIMTTNFKNDDNRKVEQQSTTITTGTATYIVQSPLFGPVPGWLGRLSLSRPHKVQYIDEPFITATLLQRMTRTEIINKLNERMNERTTMREK
mmetsp:Transcript_14083/g.33842  ORF Transcript_14083/g.33842 Transcript_14083/m.33842 type:complete len:161 (+) Transcript_14083:577-1059(+)